MIYYKTNDEIELIRQSSLLVAKTLGEVARVVEPGVTGRQIDKIADEFICDHGGKPAFKGYNGFPNALCISPNDEVVHGIPNDIAFKDGDIISVDCGVLLNDFYGDSAYTFAIGEVDPEVLKLLAVTQECLSKAIEACVSGKRVGDIGHAVQSHAELNGYGVVRELVGHGLGRSLHEGPEVPNFGRRGNGPKLAEGMVIAIEPMINMGRRQVVYGKDGWTVKTIDGKPSAHFEHTVAVRKHQAEILSSFAMIEEILKNKNQQVVKPI
ncbi:MAG: type I methionyl aminopeptidase [Flavobacteriales bacterium]